MKTILYMGISVNGYIAKEDGDSEWTSEEDLKGFYEQSKKAGNIIMGKNTYFAVSKSGYFPFPDALNIIVSHQQILFGKGIKVFADGDFEFELKLIETKKLNPNTIQLHYKIIK